MRKKTAYFSFSVQKDEAVETLQVIDLFFQERLDRVPDIYLISCII